MRSKEVDGRTSRKADVEAAVGDGYGATQLSDGFKETDDGARNPFGRDFTTGMKQEMGPQMAQALVSASKANSLRPCAMMRSSIPC